jgi:uncharacterized cofD-like protein
LAATLQALRRVTDDITAVVGVSDDGGSSGRLRREFGVIPPGDLRMALAALCGDDARGRLWARVVQHRFGGSGELSGHALGNLLIAGLWEHTDDIVAGLASVAELLGAHGRVLPLANQPLDIVAEVAGLPDVDPDTVSTVSGQVAVARTPGVVRGIRLQPDGASACPQSIAAVVAADAIIMGPGSWYTSVMPHIMLPDMRHAIETARAMRICILNLSTQDTETRDFQLHTHLDVLHALAPALRFDAVLVDRAMLIDADALAASARAVGAVVEVADLAQARGSAQHSPDLLAAALRRLLPARIPDPVAG